MSDVFAFDQKTGDSLQYIECVKGYDVEGHKLPDGGGAHTEFVTTGKYNVIDEKGGILKTISGSESVGGGFDATGIFGLTNYPYLYIPDSTMFITGTFQESTQLQDFKDDNVSASTQQLGLGDKKVKGYPSPQPIVYSPLPGNAATYNLTYPDNSNFNLVYRLLLLVKKARQAPYYSRSN